MSISHFYHAVANHGITVCVAFLEFFCDNVLTEFLILDMHNCIVQIRIKFLSHCFDRLDSDLIQCSEHLLVNKLDTVCKWLSLFLLP